MVICRTCNSLAGLPRAEGALQNKRDELNGFDFRSEISLAAASVTCMETFSDKGGKKTYSRSVLHDGEEKKPLLPEKE